MARQDPIALAATLPCWGGRVSPVPLAGGLTNDNFLVEDAGERYVVRVGGDIPAHNIVRSTEAAASRAADPEARGRSRARKSCSPCRSDQARASGDSQTLPGARAVVLGVSGRPP